MSTAAEHLPLVQGLFVQHSPELRGFVLALLPDFAAVDDVMQETFVTITKKAADFQPGTNFMAWAATIARFKALDMRRREGRRANWLSDEALESLCASQPEPEPEPDRKMKSLAECMERLAPQARRAMELRYQQAHKPAEVARLMSWSAEAVYVALSRARAALRGCVENKLAEEGA